MLDPYREHVSIGQTQNQKYMNRRYTTCNQKQPKTQHQKDKYSIGSMPKNSIKQTNQMSLAKQRNFRILNQSVDYQRKLQQYRENIPGSINASHAKKPTPFRNSVVYDNSKSGYNTIEGPSINPDTFSADQDHDGAVRINSRDSVK